LKQSLFTDFGAVVQLVRIQACHAWGRGFEPRPHRIFIVVYEFLFTVKKI